MAEWTATEDAVLAARYAAEGSRGIALESGRSIMSVRMRAQRLGLKAVGAKSRRGTVEVHARAPADRLLDDGLKSWAGPVDRERPLVPRIAA